MSLNSTPRTWVTNETVTATELNTEIRDALTGIQAAWTAYTPTITNLTLGAAIVTARYHRIGKFLELRWDVAGGTSTAATGALSMSLPAGMTTHGTGRQFLPAILSGQLGGWLFNPSSTSGAWVTATGAALSTFGSGSAFVGSGTLELA